jgi:tetratricopeptide (TPR) repeat protein
MGIPQGVRQVIGRRLSRLSEEANRFLAAASGWAGAFRFVVTAAVADLDEDIALDALDAALATQILRATGDPEVYDFTHALLRHTLYSGMSPSRQARLHRRLAEEMERRYGDQAAEHALEIAQQWHRSAVLPGAERGVAPCLTAADRAEQAAAHEEAATALGMALDLLPASDTRRPRLTARLGLALAWRIAEYEAALRLKQERGAVRVASEAGELLAASEGNDAAADYLAAAATAVWSSAYDPRSWVLAEQGLRHVGGRRDLTWAILTSFDLDRREADAPNFPGCRLDLPERREAARILIANQANHINSAWVVWESRDEAIEQAGVDAGAMAYLAGEYERALSLLGPGAASHIERGQFTVAAWHLYAAALCEAALGNLAASRNTLARAKELAERGGNPPGTSLFLLGVSVVHTFVRGEGYELLLPVFEQVFAENAPSLRWLTAVTLATSAACYAHAGRSKAALQALGRALPGIEAGAGWSQVYAAMVNCAIEALWILKRRDHADVLERNLREKVLAPDFRYPNTDARLSLARLCALTGRFDEAREWFEKARHVLDEQGARPLRAITDFDEAWMEVRRGADGDRQRALTLLDAARGPFESIGMPGWLRQAEELTQELVR